MKNLRLVSGALVAAAVITVAALASGVAAGTGPQDVADLAKVPNGDRVFANGHYWANVLRKTPRGTGTGYNAFGDAFVAAGKQWTAALCNADSDGDGYTNGEELGDPACVWTPGATAARVTDVSHPGYWASVPLAATFPGRSQAAFGGACGAPAGTNPTTAEERATLRTSVAAPEGVRLVEREALLVTPRKPGADAFIASNVSGCPHQQAGVVGWHEAATWGGAVPAAGSDVVVPAGKKVVVWGCSVPAAGYRSVTVPEGAELILGDDVVHFVVWDLIVRGVLRVGSSSCPVHQPVTITFAATSVALPTYTNALRITDRGLVEMYGASNTLTWTRLRGTAEAGATTIVLQDAVEWSVYDEVVLTTSIWKDEIDNQNEVRRIAAVDTTNTALLRLDRPLLFKHYGGAEYQSEVALLTRSVLVRSFGTEYGYGGHTMAIGADATYRVVGVRAERMGQLNRLGTYPFHLHMMYEGGPRSYFQQVACVHSFFRCCTVHGTNRTLLRKNVAFNVSGHTFYLEDGGEMYNVIEYNLAAYIHPIGAPAGGGAQVGEEFVEIRDGALLPADHTASGFYIPNPSNYLRGNAASGGWAGFSFPIFDTCLKLSTHLTVIPKQQPMLEFDGNTAHSSGYYWDDAGCVYHGGRLWVKPDGKLWYTSGRVSQPTIGWHNVTNHRSWLCQAGMASWGDRVDVRDYECHDCTRSAVLFGASSMTRVLYTGMTENLPYDMLDEARQGFQFYDTWVQTMLVNVTFKNFWLRTTEVNYWNRNCIIMDLTHSDIFKPWGISATRNLRFENVDRTILLRRWVRETGASRMFNFVDWDGSFVNTGNCSAQILGSNIDWWNVGDDCTFNEMWQSWVCPRKPGREVVGLDMNLPGIQQELDIRTGSDDMLTQAQRDQLYIGHMSQFGSKSSRRLTITRNHHLATGLSGIGWYMYVSLGMPPAIEISPVNFPRGNYILLAISYPAGTTFTSIYAKYRWGSQRTDYKPLASRGEVLQSNGSYYHFDGRHLYLKISDMWSEYPTSYARGGVQIYSATQGWYIYVNAVCGSTVPGGNCAPPAGGPDAPADLDLPVKVCGSDAEFLEPPPLCGDNVPDVPPSTFTGTCAQYKAQWRCTAPSYPFCTRTCSPDCQRTSKYPYTCSRATDACEASSAAEKPTARVDHCAKVMREFPLNDPCSLTSCDPASGVMSRYKLRPGTPCNGNGRFAVPNGTCSAAGKCTSTWAQWQFAPLGETTVRNKIRLAVYDGGASISAVAVTYELAHKNGTFQGAMTRDGSTFVLAELAEPGLVARRVSFRYTNASGAFVLAFNDYAQTVSVNPRVTVASYAAGAATASFGVTPMDHVLYAQLLLDGAAYACTLNADETAACDAAGLGKFTGNPVVQLALRDGSTVRAVFPCLVRSAGDACPVYAHDVRRPATTCNYLLSIETINSFYLSLRPLAEPKARSTINQINITDLSANPVTLTKQSWGSFSGNTGSAMTRTLSVVAYLANGEQDRYQIPFPLPSAGSALMCVSGTYEVKYASVDSLVSGTCSTGKECEFGDKEQRAASYLLDPSGCGIACMGTGGAPEPSYKSKGVYSAGGPSLHGLVSSAFPLVLLILSGLFA